MLAIVIAIALVEACTSFSDEPAAPADEAGMVDSAPIPLPDASDTSTADAARKKCDPSAPFKIPIAIAELNGSAEDSTARLSADELVVYFDSSRNLYYQLFVAVRPNRNARFSAPQLVTNVNGGLSQDRFPWVSPDNLRFVFASTRNTGLWNLYETQRIAVGVPFDPPHPLGISSPTTRDYEPFVALPNSELFFASDRDTDGGRVRIWHARLYADGGSDPPARVDLGTPAGEFDEIPVPSADGLTLFFGSSRGGKPDFDIWQVRRASLDAAWGTPTNVAEVNTSKDDGPNWLSPDGCRLYLTSNLTGNADIYVAERAR